MTQYTALKMHKLNGVKGDGADGDKDDQKLLLDMGSDSEQEQFSLPPLKLKGTNRKKLKKLKEFPKEEVHITQRVEPSCCTLRGFIVALSLLILLAAVGGLGALYYSLMLQMRQIQDNISTVETGSQSVPNEFAEIQTHLRQIDKSIDEHKIGKNGLDQLTANISSLTKQYNKLKEDFKELNKGIKAAPEIKTLPGEVETLTNSVAAFGSDINTLKDNVKMLQEFKTSTSSTSETVEDRLQKIEEGLTKLSGAPAPVNPTPGVGDIDLSETDSASLQTYLDKSLASVTSSMQNINNTLHQQMFNIQSQLKVVENRTVAVDTRLNLIELSPHIRMVLNGSQEQIIKTLVTEAVQKAVQNVDLTTASDNLTTPTKIDGNTVPLSDVTLATITAQIDNITKMVTTFEKQLSQMQAANQGYNEPTRFNATAGLQQMMGTMFAAFMNITQPDNEMADIGQHQSELIDPTFSTMMELQRKLADAPKKLISSVLLPFMSMSQPGGMNLTALGPIINTAMSSVMEIFKDAKHLQIVQLRLFEELHGNISLLNQSIGDNTIQLVRHSTHLDAMDESLRNLIATKSKLAPRPKDIITPTEPKPLTDITSSQPASTTTGQTEEVTTQSVSSSAAITIPNINDMEDLEQYFAKWDIRGNGFLEYRDLPGFLGP
ncbi:unnamed protein product, partial [Owenia fusiformis]